LKFVFEFIDEHDDGHNFINCPDMNPCGRRRFSPSSLTKEIINHKKFKIKLKNFNADCINRTIVQDNNGDRYIITAGVNNHPSDWCGNDGMGNGINPRNPKMKNLFDWLLPVYLADLKNKRAFLLLDQTLEGYQTPWLWEWFHNSLAAHSINPSQIIYVTGNLEATNQYNTWCESTIPSDKMLVLGHTIFEEITFDRSHKNSALFGLKKLLPTLAEQLKYKRKNLNLIKLYNALQKRPRPHRMWLFTKLHENSLLDDGINSMNDFDIRDSLYEGRTISPDAYYSFKSQLPVFPYSLKNDNELKHFADIDSGKYQMMFNDDIVFNSWVSVISEASFGDSEETCFISEKTFKPILTYHPFIVFGNKHSMAHLRELGYKTFHPYIDETYDTLNTWDRMNFIINELKKIQLKTDKERLYWFEGLSDILDHNYQTIKNNVKSYAPSAITTITQYIKR